jgi:iron complex outermembrane receptor protein
MSTTPIKMASQREERRRNQAHFAGPLLAAAWLVSGNARAQPLGEPEGGIEVLVRGDTAGSYAARASADDSPRPPIDAASLLAGLPSVHIRRLGAEGSLATLSVRGSASTQVGVFLAGIPLTSAADPALDVGALPLWPGATFRVYRGFAPASLGTTGYLGGVLAIEPPSPARGERTEQWAAAGSFGALKLRVGDARREGDLTLGTGLFAARSDGDFTYEATDLISRQLRTRTNAGYVTVGGIERASLDLTWGSIGALVFADTRRQGLPGGALFPNTPPTTLTRLSTTRAVVGLDATARTGERGAVRALLWGRREHAAFADPRGELDAFGRPASAEQSIEAVGGSLGWRGRLLEPLTAAFTADARGERFRPEGVRIGADRLAGGAGVDLEWRSPLSEQRGSPLELRGSPLVAVTGSARLDARRDATDGAARDPSPGDSAFVGPSMELAPSGHLGASLTLDPAFVLSAHAGALRRSPSFDELYGNRGLLRGDPSLRPERALSVDAGAHGDLGDAGFQLGYELVGFATDATDIIAFVPLGKSTFRAENLDRATLLGAELSVALATRNLRTSLSYTGLATRNTGDDPLTRDRPLPGRPAHDLAYDAAWRVGPLVLRYGLDAIAGTTVDEGGTIVLPARVFHGLGAALNLPGGLRAGVDVENLFDLRTFYTNPPLAGRSHPSPVSDFLGFPLPGRTVWMTLRWMHEHREF